MSPDLVDQAASVDPDTTRLAESLGLSLVDRSVLPLLGAGASIPCGLPRVADLVNRLAAAVADGRLVISSLPADYDAICANHDLAKMADLIYTECGDDLTAALGELGFPSVDIWPGPQEATNAHILPDHACTHVVLARMARERMLTEFISFNYDCQTEAGLEVAGMFPATRRTTATPWPETYGVVANAGDYSNLSTRANVVVNKVHGCVNRWRELTADTPQDASKQIVIRWRQLLDWRTDFWARDLFRDRARRNVLLVLGFSGLDAVIQSTLQAVFDEVVGSAHGESRVRIIDREPDQLSLRLLARAGSGDDGSGINVSSTSAAAVLSIALASWVSSVLSDESDRLHIDLMLPQQSSSRLRRLLDTGPAMLAWTWLLAGQDISGILEKREMSYYVPLTGKPEWTLRAFSVRARLAAELGIGDPDSGPEVAGAFLVPRLGGRAYLPLGVTSNHWRRPDAETLSQIDRTMSLPPGLDFVAVSENEEGSLDGFSLASGNQVML